MSSTVVTGKDILIRVRDNLWPCTIATMRSEFPGTSFPLNPTVQTCRAKGYEVVHPTPAPTGDVVVELAPTLIDGVWTQTWSASDFTEEQIAQMVEERKERLIRAVKAQGERNLNKGMEYNFGDVVEHIQIRDADRVNLIGLRIKAEQAIAAGAPETKWMFRTFENNMHQLDSTEMVALTDQVLIKYYEIKEPEWFWIDLVTATFSLTELENIANDMVSEGYLDKRP